MGNESVVVKKGRRSTPAEGESDQIGSQPLANPGAESNNAVAIPGVRLLAHLWEKMNGRGETTRQLASQLGIAYPYLMALARGERPLPQVSREILIRASEYLDVPVVQAYILAEALRPEDFFHGSTIPTEIETAYQAMARHPHWCGHIPDRKTWDKLSQPVKILICMLFERATQQTIFSYAEIEESGNHS